MATLDTLNMQMRQLYASVGSLVANPHSVEPTILAGPGGFSWMVDYRADDVDLANVSTLTLANLGNLKDNLATWTKDKNAAEAVVNSNFDVAVLFDAWNVNKHGELNQPLRVRRFPRTPPIGTPQWPKLTRSLRLTTQALTGSVMVMTIDPRTRKPVSGGDGRANIVIDGDVTDDQGQVLGSFVEMVERAVAAWEQAFRAAGVPLPAHPSPMS